MPDSRWLRTDNGFKVLGSQRIDRKSVGTMQSKWTGPESPYLPIRLSAPLAWSCLQEDPLVDKLTSLMIEAKSKQNSATSMEETIKCKRKLKLQCGLRSLSWRSLSNDDCDVNENGKKAISLDWKNNNSARASRFFLHSPVTARLWRENTLFHVLWRTWTGKATTFFFFFWTSIQSFRIQLQK